MVGAAPDGALVVGAQGEVAQQEDPQGGEADQEEVDPSAPVTGHCEAVWCTEAHACGRTRWGGAPW